VVFVAKFIDNVMPLFFWGKKAIPGDSQDNGGCEEMATAALQADARIRGRVLKTQEDVMDYLPEWLQQDGLDPVPNADIDGCKDFRQDCDFDSPAGKQRVSDCYKRKKAKQHDEVQLQRLM